MASGWFGSWRSSNRSTPGGKGKSEEKGKKVVVLDGSDIKQLVEDEVAFGGFAESKFEELDVDGDGRLSVKELKPSVADIGAALGIPARGSSPESDLNYADALNEWTHGKQEVSKSEFKEVLSDILLDMAAGLKRDPIVILRIDGEDLKEFVESVRFEPEAISMFSKLQESDNNNASSSSLRKCLTTALHQLTVEHGMPPASDSWVLNNIVEPSLRSMSSEDMLEQPASQEIFLKNLKKLLNHVVQRLQEHPVIVAHSENTFDGSSIKRLISNKFELDKLLDNVWRDLPKDRNHPNMKEYIRLALNGMTASANLPPHGVVDQVDVLVSEAIGMINADDVKIVEESEFKKTLTEILGNIMLQLEGSPVFVSTNAVVNEPLAASSTTLPPTLPTEMND
ncbi:hypothetical protein Cni_G13050 [Canna indica]|uniref:EF-hand domain-containing protein n=1 Tax=Canna indica TaxID=4628 RepID=A0AAQ3K986_9LILI|nr:hypothetical protein Cni_G13050 [Canna indica]